MPERDLPQLTRRLSTADRVDAVASLRLDQRTRSRQRIRLDDGREAGILLPRGETLKDGDLLADEHGLVVQIRAAAEQVSTARTEDPLLLARACWHLGNRHVALEIRPGRLRWLHDHVLDAMVRGLGLVVAVEQAPFQPEPGAYGSHPQGAHQGHGHGH